MLLARGFACSVCRRRKTRCDGSRPLCGTCVRYGFEDECDYPFERPSRTTLLEEQVRQLQEKIRELEGANTTKSPKRTISADEGLDFECLPIWNTSTGLQEPSAPVISTLLQAFGQIASDVNFFLCWRRFKQSALASFTFGHHSRPTRAVLSAVYLWATRILCKDPANADSPLLNGVAQLISEDLATDHPQRVLHTLQAQVLLSEYCFLTGRVLDGRRQMRAATSLMYRSGLHKYRSDRYQHSGILATFRIPDAVSGLGALERLNAFWAVMGLNNCWSAPFNMLSFISYSDPQLAIETPWPLDENDSLTPDAIRSNGETVKLFLQGVPDQAASITAMYAKAAALYELASPTELRYASPDDLNFSVNKLRAILPTLACASTNSVLLLCPLHALLCCANIRLHGTYSLASIFSRTSRFFAALEVIEWSSVYTAAKGGNCGIIPPVLCVLWRQACMAIVDEHTLLKSGSFPLLMPEEQWVDQVFLSKVLCKGLDSMQTYSSIPLMRLERTNVEVAATAAQLLL